MPTNPSDIQLRCTTTELHQQQVPPIGDCTITLCNELPDVCKDLSLVEETLRLWFKHPDRIEIDRLRFVSP